MQLSSLGGILPFLSSDCMNQADAANKSYLWQKKWSPNKFQTSQSKEGLCASLAERPENNGRGYSLSQRIVGHPWHKNAWQKSTRNLRSHGFCTIAGVCIKAASLQLPPLPRQDARKVQFPPCQGANAWAILGLHRASERGADLASYPQKTKSSCRSCWSQRCHGGLFVYM